MKKLYELIAKFALTIPLMVFGHVGAQIYRDVSKYNCEHGQKTKTGHDGVIANMGSPAPSGVKINELPE